jgi:chemotaxis receptor (MCP) glutamine deamidase CheD
MNIPMNARPRSPEHRGAVQNLRVRSDLPQAAAGGASPAERARAPHRHRITLYIGEVAASQLPIVLDTLLGSCVAVCMYDPLLRAGGMNHILLPTCRVGDRNPRCGVHAMELLINEVMKLGGDRRRFIAKAFGGANVLRGMKMPAIGDGNARFVREFLATEKISLVAERLGGNHAVHLYFQPDTGKATVHTVDGSSLPKILTAERSYCKLPSADKYLGGEITIF